MDSAVLQVPGTEPIQKPKHRNKAVHLKGGHVQIYLVWGNRNLGA